MPARKSNLMALYAGEAPLRRRWWPAMPSTQGFSGRLAKLGKLEIAAIVAFTGLTVFLLFVPLLLPYAGTQQVGDQLTGVSGQHWFGIDEQGRDVLSRSLLGMRASWFSAWVVIASGVVIGGHDRSDRRDDRRMGRQRAHADHRRVPRDAGPAPRARSGLGARARRCSTRSSRWRSSGGRSTPGSSAVR